MSSVRQGKLFAVEVKGNGAAFEVGAPQALFDTGFEQVANGGVSYNPYAVSPDGQRFLIPRPPSELGP